MRTRFIAISVLLFTMGSAAPARADGFFIPFAGYDFGGGSGCPKISSCEDRTLNVGVAFGTVGSVLGFEEEFAYAKNFFGTAPGLESSVLTLMSNVMLAPKIGLLRPYALAGVGLVKTHVSFTPSSVLASDNNHVGWDVGGGLMLLFGDHVGVRGDIRYFHSFQDLNLLGFSLESAKLDFGRASGGLVLKF